MIKMSWEEDKDNDEVMTQYKELVRQDLRRYQEEILPSQKKEPRGRLRVEKNQTKKKTAFHFFQIEEKKKLRHEFPKYNRQMLHEECQKRWKILKVIKNDRYNYFIEKSKEEDKK